ncbi:MAG: sigma-70 family RNA polymerase sigma factor [Ruminococcaceae bacterium]|nr:sigma-70 family RNA polymerase sigma factor [Oscillospiraceae bacterium]
MDEETLLQGIGKKDPAALEAVIDRYGTYIRAIIHGKADGHLSLQDEEEIASDVFLSLWKQSDSLLTGHLRAWLAATARNRTVDFLRRRKLTLPLEEDCFLVEDAVWQEISDQTLREIVRSALDELSSEDREIFLRHYELEQSIPAIARELALSPSAVKMRLFRGRRAIRKQLEERGITIEDCLS